jgi:hypothetical protein
MSTTLLLRLRHFGGILRSVRGGTYVRVGHRGGDRRQLHRSHWLALSLSLLASSAQATPPLMPATDIAQVGLVAWWRQGELLVGVPSAPDRPGMRPLVSTMPAPLPSDLSSWEPIGHTCQPSPRGLGSLGKTPIEAVVIGDEEQPIIALMMQKRVVAQNALGHPAQVCEIRIVQADQLPGLELIIAWRMGGDGAARGVTVFRIPEALDGAAKTADEG